MGEPVASIVNSTGSANTSAVSLTSNNQSDAPIKKVVVHPDCAVIHRIWTKQLHPGVHHVRFTNFYQQYYTGSLRICISGPATINEVIETATLLNDEDRLSKVGNVAEAESVTTENGGSAAADSRLEALLKQKSEHKMQLEFLSKRLESWEAYRQVVMGKTQSPPANIFKEGAFTDLYDFFWKYEGEFVRLRNVIQQTERALRSVQNSISRHQTGNGPVFCKVSDIRVVIVVADSSDRSKPVTLDISYAVREAAWSPKYDLRFSEKTVQLSYFACISQWSGEEWTDIELSVTSRNNRWSAVTDQSESDLQVPLSNGPASTEMQLVREIVARNALDKFSFQKNEAEHTREVTYGDFTIQLPESVSISHGKSMLQLPLVKALHLGCEYRYKCEPGLDGHVHRKATVTNNSSFILAPGVCSIYVDGQFVGNKRLSNVAPMEDITVSLGIDESITVMPKVPVKVNKPLTGPNVSDGNFNVEAEYTQEYDVKNTNKFPVSITFVTTFPTSNNPRFKVTPMHPQITGRSQLEKGTIPQNQGKQKVDIPATTTRSIRSIYKLEYPHNLSFTIRNYFISATTDPSTRKPDK